MEIDEEDLMQHPDRLKWYEAKYCADDQPDWNPARFVRSEDVAPNTRNVVLEIEVSRERVPLRNAYKCVGQRATVRVAGGFERSLAVASAPHPQALNKDALFRVRNDMVAEEIKAVKEALTTMAELHLLVTKDEAPELYNMEEGQTVEVGPFSGTGLDLRGSALLAIYRFPTVVLFVEGAGIAHARALVESSADVANLNLKFRTDVRMYYKAPNEASLCYRDRFESWEELGCKVSTTTGSLQEAFDDDDTFAYTPEYTAAIILTGGDEEAEKAAREVCKEAEITEVLSDSSQQASAEYLSAMPSSFARWIKDPVSSK